jgi:hypothetical protein
LKYANREEKRIARADYPTLEYTTRPDDCTEVELPSLPAHEARRLQTSRSPLAVIAAYRVEIYLRLATLLGVRMCPDCPRCNILIEGCQDLFGSNMRPGGGILGGMPALGGGTEHQLLGAPHFHFEGHIACMYQYGTLAEVAQRIQSNLSLFQDLLVYNEVLHKTDIIDKEVYDEFRPRVEEAFQNRFEAAEHDALCSIPRYLAQEAGACTNNVLGSPGISVAAIEEEGALFRAEYLKDAQYVFSRVQHHVHLKTKEGYVPLSYCARKERKSRNQKIKSTGKCKQDFPMTSLIMKTSAVVCQGVAKRLGLRVSGRRNALGKIMNARTCEWQSGTSLAMATCFRANTHTAPNYRVPLLPCTHTDALCRSKACRAQIFIKLPAEEGTAACATDKLMRQRKAARFLKILGKLAQRAQREATGYYCGYTFKAQPVGAKYLRAAGESLNYLDIGLKDKTAGQLLHPLITLQLALF